MYVKFPAGTVVLPSSFVDENSGGYLVAVEPLTGIRLHKPGCSNCKSAFSDQAPTKAAWFWVPNKVAADRLAHLADLTWNDPCPVCNP